jgi:hypothetical protein
METRDLEEILKKASVLEKDRVYPIYRKYPLWIILIS